ncbi:MAG: hypothetical protein LBI95_02800 [Holosporales bacterium]|jgi:hypothetical protein|nr:hypothetical protein [Holosporales bacterium]
MSKKIEKFKQILNFYKVLLIKNSIFYKLSLNKKGNIFDPSKFITDPWTGDFNIGKNMLDCTSLSDNLEFSIEMLEDFSINGKEVSRYLASFVWIRDVQSVGGNNSRKYVRNLISTFINRYRKTRKFWQNEEAWNCAIIGDRIVNWICSYSFFASGANDKFQKEVLSSIAEQFSHLANCYKAEFNPYARLMALKAILFCLCTMKANQKGKIRRTIKEIKEVIQKCIKGGVFENRSPVDHFHVFRTLLEIRFISKINGIELPLDIFGDILSKLASVTRFLRLGDGNISLLSGDFPANSVFIPTRHMIDIALSIVNIKDHFENLIGFEKLATKKATIIINTKPCEVKSKFNPISEPGVNIFDFEASFGIEKLINRSDVSIVFDGYRIKLGKNAEIFFQKSMKDSAVLFEGETHFSNKLFKFALRREIEVSTDKFQIKGTDFVFLSNRLESYFRFVFNNKCNFRQINQKSILVSLLKSEYIFNVNSINMFEINILQRSDINYPAIEVLSRSDNLKEIEFSWVIEHVK